MPIDMKKVRVRKKCSVGLARKFIYYLKISILFIIRTAQYLFTWMHTHCVPFLSDVVFAQRVDYFYWNHPGSSIPGKGSMARYESAPGIVDDSSSSSWSDEESISDEDEVVYVCGEKIIRSHTRDAETTRKENTFNMATRDEEDDYTLAEIENRSSEELMSIRNEVTNEVLIAIDNDARRVRYASRGKKLKTYIGYLIENNRLRCHDD